MSTSSSETTPYRLVRGLAVAAGELAPMALRAQEPDSTMMMEKWQQYMTPGPAHKELAGVAGEWTWESTYWPGPGAPEQKSSGMMTARTIMGDRYLVEDWKGSWIGMPFEGQSLTGYDNAKGRYFNVWVDNLGTGVMTSWGTRDEASNTLTLNGSYVDPVTGKEQPARSVTRDVDEGYFIFEMYGPAPDGKEFKMFQLHARRRG